MVKAVWNAALRYLGEKGAGAVSLWVMDWDEASQKGIMKVNHRSVDDIKAAMTLLSEIKKGARNTCSIQDPCRLRHPEEIKGKTGIKGNPKPDKNNQR